MKKICVYCGSRNPEDPEIEFLSVELGKAIAKRGLGLVYGGGKVGMMGLLANAALEEHGTVIGIIPSALKRMEVVHNGLTELHETQDMHTRKALMETLSDLFIVLPGGFGTMDEFFEILTWRQLGIHDKPIILVNMNGYFDGFKQFLNTALEQDFIRNSSLELFHMVDTFEECVEIFEKELGLN